MTLQEHKMLMKNSIKIVLAILLFLCLFSIIPYGYYQFVRFFAMGEFIFLAYYYASGKKNKTEMIVYVTLAILFQPLFTITFDRTFWNIVNVIVGIGLVVSVFMDKSKPSASRGG